MIRSLKGDDVIEIKKRNFNRQERYLRFVLRVGILLHVVAAITGILIE